MPRSIHDITAEALEGKVVKSSSTCGKLESDEVLVQVTHSGLCGRDLHYLNQDIALGHEAVGIVKAVGTSCTLLKEGDRVGWGYEPKACGVCSQCLSGSNRYCPDAKMYGQSDFDQGSFSDIGVWKESATVFTPLIEYCRPIDRVGIVGISGLGHLAIHENGLRYRCILCNKMLEFADRNNVKPMIEKFPMSEEGINEAIQKLKDGKIRYRVMLSWDY
ncbi:GroES-like protein [Gymnopus androsaceus JB14]|uniref:GroES-like protein n=1 Tax=Gymnopus androsaceus JB14 TaxID=1447944 RepID=A0A6A4H722_9AGAR|nr:GroES-like protein [Gymnopus androsaceus JB14]